MVLLYLVNDKQEETMLQKRSYPLALFLLLALLWFGCSELKDNTPLSPEGTMSASTLSKSASIQEKRMLSAFAQTFAAATNNADLQARLLQAISESNSREKIVSLKSLLEANSFARAVSASAEFIQSIEAHPLGIDVYFPVDAHRQAILANPQREFLVTYYDGYQDDQVESQFPA
ncbi:MAG: hypothetical protein ONA90_03510 [candidate division KSB1 bacterium]|nr:hypothetical protein [candidate division KSB1 bacterium]